MLPTIKSKFILALLGTLIPSILLCLFLLNSLHTSKNNVGTLYNRDFTGSALASSIDGQLTRVDINILRMIAIGTPELITQWKQENQTRFTQVAASIVELKQLLSQEAERHRPAAKDHGKLCADASGDAAPDRVDRSWRYRRRRRSQSDPGQGQRQRHLCRACHLA